MTHKATKAQPTAWEQFEALDDTPATTTDRYAAAGEYANWSTPEGVSDEEWAQAFWTAWHGYADDHADPR